MIATIIIPSFYLHIEVKNEVLDGDENDERLRIIHVKSKRLMNKLSIWVRRYKLLGRRN